MSNGNKANTVKAIVTLIGISVATVSGVVIPLAVWFHSMVRDMRSEDMRRMDSQFAKIDIASEATRKEQINGHGRLSAIEKSIEMILNTRRENMDEFNKRFDRIDTALLRLEAKIK